MRSRLWLLVVAVAFLPPTRPTQADPLFDTLPTSGATGSRAVPQARGLALRAAELARVRSQATARVTGLPIGRDGIVDLELERFDPRGPNLRVEVIEATGGRPVSVPDDVYFRGQVRGAPDTHVLLVAAPDHVRAWVATNGTVYRLGLDERGVHHTYALRDLPAGSAPPPEDFCGQQGQAHLRPIGSGGPRAAGPAPGAPLVADWSPVLLTQVAIDTDQELRAKFPSDAAAAAYVIDLVAAATTIYQSSLDVQLLASYVRLWDVTDPWSASSTSGALNEVQSYWTNPGNGMNSIAGPRDLVHFVSGKPVRGGIAYLDVLCNPTYGYAVSQVHGSFDILDPSSTWDLIVFSHETGHIFGSPHTHCYSPPLDRCYNEEPNCYGGPETPSSGTIMSYCHLSGGLSAIQLTLGPTVGGLMRSHAEASTCVLAITCGDGVLSSGEECDDGNQVGGDCCSATCSFEPAGGSCDDDNSCTATDECQANGLCAGTPVTNGTPCDDGSLCTADACDGGICVGLPAPSSSCRVPVASQSAALSINDRASSTSDRLSFRWKRGPATDLADFGSPVTTTDYELCVYGGGSTWLGARVPAGELCNGRACWAAAGTGFKYKDSNATPDGITQLSLSAGSVGKPKATLKGKGAALGLPSLTALALPVQVQLRHAGDCFGASFSTPSAATADVFKAKSD